MASGSTGRMAELLQVIMRSESLDELPEAPLDPTRTSFIAKLMKSEILPYDEAERGGAVSPPASGLFASERLAMDDNPAVRGARPSILRALT